MKQFAFSPSSVTIQAGGRVTWTYDESLTDPLPNCESAIFQLPVPVPGLSCPGHSTTAATKGADGRPVWDSGIHRADGFPFTVTVNIAGTYDYVCVVHASSPFGEMVGRVTVVAAPLPVAAPTVVGGPSTPAPALAPRPTPTGRTTGAASGDGSVLAISGGGPDLGLLALLALAALGSRRLIRSYPATAGPMIRSAKRRRSPR